MLEAEQPFRLDLDYYEGRAHGIATTSGLETGAWELGAGVEVDVYRGTALHWAAWCGRVEAIRTLLRLGADPNRRAAFGGPDHGQGVPRVDPDRPCRRPGPPVGPVRIWTLLTTMPRRSVGQ